MGEGKRSALRVDFDGQIRLEFHGANVTSDASLLAYRELDESLGLTTEVDGLSIHDPRTGQNTQHNVTAMMRQSVYSRLAGYEDTNDAERLRVDRPPCPLRDFPNGGSRDSSQAVPSDSETDRPAENEKSATGTGMMLCFVAKSPLLKANAGTVRFQTRFAVFLGIERRLKRARTTRKGGMTHHLAVSSGQLAAGAVRTDSIWEMSVNMSGKIKIKMQRPDSDSVYVALPGYPDPVKPGVVRKSVSLDDIYDYQGPRVQLDSDENGKLIGVEVVA